MNTNCFEQLQFPKSHFKLTLLMSRTPILICDGFIQSLTYIYFTSIIYKLFIRSNREKVNWVIIHKSEYITEHKIDYSAGCLEMEQNFNEMQMRRFFSYCFSTDIVCHQQRCVVFHCFAIKNVRTMKNTVYAHTLSIFAFKH